ncbi:MAG: hypothetical protein EON87_09360 [Brevundimonas sp.]|nr:MAG: hypothetical protein EON87_09360 [Brevundimonas sp.]
MLKIIAALAALVVPSAALAQTPEPAPAPIEVMILGSYHMDNPGNDVHNARIAPVTTPEKQAQLQVVSRALARFNPTAIGIERVADDPATFQDQAWAAFTPADLLTNPDERFQIGYRLAHDLGLQRVYAIDEQDRDGQPSYFPFGEVMQWVEANGKQAQFDELNSRMATVTAEMERRQSGTVTELLAWMNTPEYVAYGQGVYAGLMTFGDGADQPGPYLNGRWYTRNAIIFANLMKVARPGDRIVVIYGAGHGYWLRQLVSTTPGYRLVEPNDYLLATD